MDRELFQVGPHGSEYTAQSLSMLNMFQCRHFCGAFDLSAGQEGKMAPNNAASVEKFDVTFPQGLGGLHSLDLSLNGLSSVPLGLLDELQNLRYI